MRQPAYLWLTATFFAACSEAPMAPPNATADATADGPQDVRDAAADTIVSEAAAADADADAAALTLSLQLTPIPTKTVGTTATFSASSLRATWTNPPVPFHHVRFVLTGGNDTFTHDAPAQVATFDLTDLFSSTSYTVATLLCSDASCTTSVATTGNPTANVPAEVWVIQGSGDGVNNATKVVADGNVRIHAISYGPGAPSAQLGRIQLYYGPQGSGVDGLVVGLAKQVAANTVSTLNAFDSLAGSSGVERPTPSAPYISQVATGQAVPTSGALGDKIRLYFEANGTDNKTRIVYVDSADGYVGRDFNKGTDTRCRTAADYAVLGGCEAKVAIGVSGDTGDWGFPLQNARQFKVGVKTLDDWRWRGEPGTFMWVTIDSMSGCTTTDRNQVYAVWDGAAWKVQKDPQKNCPLMLGDAQAPSPLHLGGSRFKMYFGAYSNQAGKLTSSKLPFLGPKVVVYANGARTGNTDTVDYADWDARPNARDVTFLWPSGAALTQTDEGYLDDFVHLTPTFDKGLQVAYLAMTDGSKAPFSVLAILANP